MTGRKKTTLEKFDEALKKAESLHYDLCLYITGVTPRSTQAIACLQSFCEQYLKGRYTLQIIDVYQQPEIAAQNQIIATPTLVKKLPLPTRKLVGDFSDEVRLFHGLGLHTPA
jgi:circadian clock protein KaiB